MHYVVYALLVYLSLCFFAIQLSLDVNICMDDLVFGTIKVPKILSICLKLIKPNDTGELGNSD